MTTRRLSDQQLEAVIVSQWPFCPPSLGSCHEFSVQSAKYSLNDAAKKKKKKGAGLDYRPKDYAIHVKDATYRHSNPPEEQYGHLKRPLR